MTATSERPSGVEVDALRPHAHGGNARHGGRFPSIVDAIGFTPLVEVPNVCPNPNVRLYAKLEFMNPTGSVKDRVAKYLIEDLERAGRLRPDSIIIEPTSGNTGIGAGHDRAPQGLSRGRRGAGQRDHGAAPAAGALRRGGHRLARATWAPTGPIALAKHLVARDARFVMPYQYGNEANPRAHEETTAEEIIADCPEVDAFVAGLGTGGTLMGVGRRLRRHNPDVRIYAAEPLPGERVQGLRSLEEGFIPEIFDASVLDGRLLVSNAQAIEALRELTDREGIFAGVSCGAVMVAAKQLAREMERGTIVALLADGGWKYLSEDIWTRDLDADEDVVDSLNLW